MGHPQCGGFSNRRLGHRSLPDYRTNILTVSFLGVNDVLHHLWNMDSPKFNSVPVLRCSVLSGKRLQPLIFRGELLNQSSWGNLLSAAAITFSELKACRVPARRLRGPGVSNVVSANCGVLLCSSSFLVDIRMPGAWGRKFRAYAHSYTGRELEYVVESHCPFHAGKPVL
jgi:hypothetical protein